MAQGARVRRDVREVIWSGKDVAQADADARAAADGERRAAGTPPRSLAAEAERGRGAAAGLWGLCTGSREDGGLARRAAAAAAAAATTKKKARLEKATSVLSGDTLSARAAWTAVAPGRRRADEDLRTARIAFAFLWGAAVTYVVASRVWVARGGVVRRGQGDAVSALRAPGGRRAARVCASARASIARAAWRLRSRLFASQSLFRLLTSSLQRVDEHDGGRAGRAWWAGPARLGTRTGSRPSPGTRPPERVRAARAPGLRGHGAADARRRVGDLRVARRPAARLADGHPPPGRATRGNPRGTFPAQAVGVSPRRRSPARHLLVGAHAALVIDSCRWRSPPGAGPRWRGSGAPRWGSSRASRTGA